MIKGILEVLGLEPERVFLTWIGASEGPQFAQWAHRIDQFVKEKGLNPLNKSSIT